MTEEIKALAMHRLQREASENERFARYSVSGKLSPRKRLSLLFDGGSFVELGAMACSQNSPVEGDAVITAYGTVNGRLAYAYSQDYTVAGGSLGSVQADKIVSIQKKALDAGAPIVALLESGGARIQEGARALDGYGRIFNMNIVSSGRVPQLAVVFGSCAGGAAYSPALMDFVIAVEQHTHMFITGPDVVKAVSGEDIKDEELGGSDVLAAKNGVAHFVACNEIEAIDSVKRVLSYLVSCPTEYSGPDLSSAITDVIPEKSNRAYDMKEVICSVFDEGSFYENQKDWACNCITAFARIDGNPVAVISNQPMIKAGCIDIDASAKMSRFIRTADSFGLPVITFVDTPGYLPGREQEYGGIIKHGAKLLYAYAEAKMPKITVIVRKAFGGAYIAMGSKALGADVVFAYPFSEIAVMGAEAAMSIIGKKEIAASTNPAEKLKELADSYTKDVMNPLFSAKLNLIDEIIIPAETRTRIISSLFSIRREKAVSGHGNIPL